MSDANKPLSSNVKKPLVLLILDGFGYSEVSKYNAIANANAPVWKKVCASSPNTTIATSGLEVGLPEGQMGNSEVGHMTLGAGRVIYQNFTRINKAIKDGDFFTNKAYTDAVDSAIANDKAVHIFGLLSDGGVHSHEDHLLAALKLAAERGIKKLYLHAFLDGRDTPPRSAKSALAKAEAAIKELGVGQIASVVGRFYALDRDNRWDRIEQAYDVMVNGQGKHTAQSAQQALDAAYERDENDEFVAATTIVAEGQSAVRMEDGDSAIFMNFRPDRAREITHAIIDEDFSGFERKRSVKLAHYVMTTEYSADIKTPCAFPPVAVINSLGEVLQNAGKKQLRIAETEKYAHVTFFFSGGQETLYEGEERILIPSPDVATYDLKPEMSAEEVTDKLVAAIESNTFDAIICNYANCDQVGHSGVYEAAIKAVETVDTCMGRVFASLEKVGGHALVTADHGNVEEMFDEVSNQVHTQHTTLPVPLAYVGPVALSLKSGGSLADIAPTMLALMGIEQPKEMTGQTLAILK